MEESSACEWQENIVMEEKLVKKEIVVLVNENGDELPADTLENLASDNEALTFEEGNYFCVVESTIEHQNTDGIENVTVEQINIMGTTADESMAVEALSQLGGMFNILPEKTINQPSYGCDTCGEQFCTIRDLQEHHPKCPIRVVKVHVCNTCNESFDREGELTNHMVCHQTDKPHACRVCGNLFRRKADLYNHMTSHQLLRPHLCSECGVDFQRPSSLTNHMKIHKYHPGRLMASSSLLNIVKDVDEPAYVVSDADIKPEGLTEVVPHTSEDSSIPHAVYYETIADSSVQSNKNLALGLSSECWTNNENLHSSIVEVNRDTSDQVSSQKDEDPLILEPQYFDFVQDYTECSTVDVETSSPADELKFSNERKSVAKTAKQKKSLVVLSGVSGSEGVIEVHTVPYPEPEEDDEEDGLLYSVDEDLNIGSGPKPDETRPHKCDQCNMSFSRLKALECHAQIHEDQWGPNYQCVKCAKLYPDITALNNHQQFCQGDGMSLQYEATQQDAASHSLANKGKHDCPDCEKKFTTKQKLFRHMWIHRKKHIECEMCGASAATQADLDTHRRHQHPGDTPFVCPTCSKSFASRQSLWEHGRVHGGPAASNYWCHECKKSFSSRQGYLIHTRTHTGERPYGCRYCLKAFRDGGTLRKHERIHTGERPHVCPICYRAFNQKVVLREHVRWVHAANRSGDDMHLYTCQVCSRILGDREELCAHIVKHSDELAKLAKDSVGGAKSAKSKDARPLNTVPIPAFELKVNKYNVPSVRIKKKARKAKLSPSNASNIQKPKKRASKSKSRSPGKKTSIAVAPSREYTLQVDLAATELVQTQAEKMHQCGMCSESFDDRIELLSHVRIHI